MRDEATGVLDSVRETIRIGEEGGLPTQVTHHKVVDGTFVRVLAVYVREKNAITLEDAIRKMSSFP